MGHGLLSVQEDRRAADAAQAARARLKPPTRRLMDAITDTLQAHTGHPYALRDAEEVGEVGEVGAPGEASAGVTGALRLLAVWEVWGAPARRYVLSARRVRVGVYQASVGVRAGSGPVETRLDVRLQGWGLRALLEDPAHVVGLMLGQRAGFFRGLAPRTR